MGGAGSGGAAVQLVLAGIEQLPLAQVGFADPDHAQFSGDGVDDSYVSLLVAVPGFDSVAST